MKKLLYISLLLLLGNILFQSCDEDNCPLNTISLGHFDFADSKTRTPLTFTSPITVTGFIVADVTLKDTLSDGTVVDRVVKDSVISDTLFNKATSSLSLPLSYTSKTTYILHYSDTVNTASLLRDTIVLNYKSIPYLQNIECGTLMFFKVNDVKFTTNVLDSVVITNPDINNEEKRNFIIYYRTE